MPQFQVPQLSVSHELAANRPSQGFLPFGVNESDAGRDPAWVGVVGELDLATVPQLERALRSAQLRAQRVVLDLRELTFIDCRGVHAIVNASIRARRAGRRLIVVRGPSQVSRVFALTDTARGLEVVDLNAGEPPVQALV